VDTVSFGASDAGGVTRGIRDRARVGVDVVGVVEVGACVVMSWVGRSATEGVGTTTVIDRHDGWWIFVEDIYG